MDLKYTNRIKDNEAFILLNDEITLQNSAMIADEMYWHHAQGLQITVKINSPGGNVIGGYSIIDAVLTTKANTHVIGLAASMAGIIFLFGKKRIANSNATLMIHPPTGGDKKFLEIIRQQLKDILVGRSNMSEDEVTSLIGEGGVDSFYNIDQMEKMGLVDERINVNQPVSIQNKNPQELYAVYNSIITNKAEMDLKEIKNTLKLADNASEERVNEAVRDLKSKYTEAEEKILNLEVEKEELTNKVKDYEKKEKELSETRAKELIENAVKAGKITEQGKEAWLKSAQNDYDLAKQTLESLKASEEQFSVSDLINQQGQKSFKDMTQAEKEKLARENPEAYNKLVEKEFEVK